MTIPKAFEALKRAMHKDLSYAWSWHCNIAMPIHDHGVPHRFANECAAKVMEHLFNVDITKSSEWQSTFGEKRNAAGAIPQRIKDGA